MRHLDVLVHHLHRRKFAVPGAAAAALMIIVAAVLIAGALTRYLPPSESTLSRTAIQSVTGSPANSAHGPGTTTRSTATKDVGGTPAVGTEPTVSSGSGDSSTSTPSGGTSTPTPTGEGVCCTATPTTPPAPSPTPDGYDGRLVSVTPSPLTLYSGGDSPRLDITLENTGTEPWHFLDGGDAFSVKCLTFCNTSLIIIDPLPIQIPPGAQYTRHGYITAPTTDLRSDYVSHWALQHNGITFGQDIAIPFTVRGWYPILQQSAPSCDNPAGTTWDTALGSPANSVTCTPSGLVLQQGAPTSPRLTLTSAAVPYDPNMLHLLVHVHFADAAGSSSATFLLHAPASASQCGGDEYRLSPVGQMVWISIHADCSQTGSIVYNFPFASQDYDVTIIASNSSDCFQIDQGPAICTAASTLNGTVGLSIKDATASNAAVTFSSFALEQYGP